MDLGLSLILLLIALCDGLGSAFQFLGWLLAWPFNRTARGFFAVAHWLTFGSLER